ncbi:MAG: STAS/SEC14 domain-containing protein [Polyangiaceae bacterium]
MKQPSHKWVVIDDLMISLTVPGRAPDSVWADCAKELTSKRITRYLAMGIGELDVTSVQRKMVSEACISRGIEVAVLTDEGLVRGLVTAVGWLGVKIKAFPFSKLDEALAHLKLTKSMTEEATRAVVRMKMSYQPQ